MKKLDLGQTAGILENVGVIAGIVFHGMELQQNNRLLETEARLELARNRISVHELLATNFDLSSAFIRAQEGETLSSLDRFRLDRFYRALFRRWEWEYEQHLEGTLEESDLPIAGMRNSMRVWPGLVEAWHETKQSSTTTEFMEFIDENVLPQ